MHAWRRSSTEPSAHRQSSSQELTFREQNQNQTSKRVPQEGAAHDGVLIDFLLVFAALVFLLYGAVAGNLCIKKTDPVDVNSNSPTLLHVTGRKHQSCPLDFSF